MQWTKDLFWITDDIQSADLEYIYQSLVKTYWAVGRPREAVEKSLEKSVLMSVFDGRRQIGFIRIVSDFILHAWLCDFYMEPDFRGRGLGKWLFECCLEHPATQVRSNILMTEDAHELYSRYGFERVECMRLRRDIY